MAEDRKEVVVELDIERARRFFKQLEEDPFVCVVLAEESERVVLYSKGISDEHLRRIKAALEQIGEEKEELGG